MPNTPGERRANGAAVLALPSTIVTNYFAGAILVLGLAGVLTQGVAVATGRDFVFGLVPKLSPDGYRNLPVWFVAAGFAVSAAFAAVAALAPRPQGMRVATRWGVLAIALAALSAERLAALVTSLDRLTHAARVAPPMLLLGVAAAATAIVYGWCIYDLPRGVRARFVTAAGAFAGGVTLCAFAPSAGTADPLQERIVRVAMMSAGRMLELAGIALFLDAVVAYLRSQVDEVRIVVNAQQRRVLDSEIHGAVLLIRLSTRRIRAILGQTALALLAGGLSALLLREQGEWDIEHLYRFLGLDFEGNLPTWFSSLLLLACAACLACIAAAHRHAEDPIWRTWTLLALLFAGMSADEAAGLHELSVDPLRSLLRGNPWFRYPLLLPGIAAATVAYITFARFLRALPDETRHQLFRGFALILLGALGVETIGGWFDPVLHGPSITYAVLTTLEEGLEMFGAIAVLGALLRHVEQHLGPLSLPGGRLDS